LETTLYQVVQDYFETWLTQLEAETGASSPDFVKDEFDAFSNAEADCVFL